MNDIKTYANTAFLSSKGVGNEENESLMQVMCLKRKNLNPSTTTHPKTTPDKGRSNSEFLSISCGVICNFM